MVPSIKGLTETFVLIECEYLKPVPSKEEAENVKETVCKYCGLQRDASLRNPPLHMVCLHRDSPFWSKFLKMVEIRNVGV